MAIRSRARSGGTSHASGASAVARAALSRNGLPTGHRLSFKGVSSPAVNMRVGGSTNAVASTAIQPPEEE